MQFPWFRSGDERLRNRFATALFTAIDILLEKKEYIPHAKSVFGSLVRPQPAGCRASPFLTKGVGSCGPELSR
jgi:hypothetical protein